MRAFVFYFIACATLCAQDRPNIVFLLTDDQTTYSLGCYGNEDVRTPNIDALARDGVTFDKHYNTTAICMASRANIMTGLYEYRNGCNFEHGALVRAHWQRSYPILLREAGYRTAIAGKIGFEVTDEPGTRGKLPKEDFDKWGAGPGQTHYETAKNVSMAAYAKDYPHATRSYGAFGRDFIRESARTDDPFCLSISFKAPHRPVTPDPLDDSIYANKSFKKPINYGREHGKHFAEQSRHGRQYERFHSWGYADDYDRVMAKYHQQIYAVDVAVGMIRSALQESGVAGNTVIIFTSDNGFLCGSHGYGSKVLPYEEASRAPLIIVDPRQFPSKGYRRSAALTGNIDLMPTILEYAGVSIPENLDGRSLIPVMKDQASSVRASLTLINVWGPRKVHSLTVVTPSHKYIYWPYDEGDFTPTEEFFDLASEPYERKHATDASVLAAMRNRYDQAVAHWKKHAVPYHRYQPYGDIFTRKQP